MHQFRQANQRHSASQQAQATQFQRVSPSQRQFLNHKAQAPQYQRVSQHLTHCHRH